MDYILETFGYSDDHADFLTKGSNFLSDYGWYIFGGLVLLALFWPRIQKFLDKLYVKFEDRRYAAKYHKNPDLALERLEGMQAARERMQRELDRKAKEHEEKMKEKEIHRAKEKIAKAEGKCPGYRLGEGSSSGSAESGYFPLMGDTSHGYRAPRKKGCPGGGCGK